MELSKHRFETFSDGVMAIIITIIVLQIPLSNDFSLKGILTLLYLIFIFFVSFFIVGYFWNRHHGIFDSVEKITNRIVWRNMLFLFFLALLPIFTRWVLQNPTEIIPVVSYDILFVLLNICYFVLVREVINDRISEKASEVKEGKENSASVDFLPEHLQDHIAQERKENSNREHTPLQLILMGLVLIVLIIIAIIFPEVTIVLSMGFPLFFALLGIFFEDKEEWENNRNHQ